MRRISRKPYAVCKYNRGYEASLEICKIYQILPDKEGGLHDMVRVIDESGEDYLYPSRLFVMISVPQTVESVLLKSVKQRTRRITSTKRRLRRPRQNLKDLSIVEKC
jgi:hypothetical protein